MRNAYGILALAVIVLYAPLTAEASVALGNIAAASISNGLVGYWPLDGNTISWNKNTFYDMSGMGNNATSTGMSTSSSPITGKIGQALRFNGSDELNLTSPSGFTTATAPRSMTGWIKIGSTGTTMVPFVYGSCTPNGGAFGIYIDTARVLHFWGCGDDIQTTTTLSTGVWYDIAIVTTDGIHVTIYVNGLPAYTSTVSSGSLVAPSGNSYLEIGGAKLVSGSTPFYFIGSVDDVRVYTRALSAAEVAQLYAAGMVNADHSASSTGGLSSGLAGYWPLDGSTINWKTDTAQDLSGNGNTASLIGLSTTTSPVPGKIGQALQFTTNSQYASSTVAASATGYSVSTWIRYRGSLSSTSLVVAVGYGIGGSGTLWMGLINGHYAISNSSSDMTSSAPIDTQRWHHLVAVISGGVLTGYLDGVSIGSESVTARPGTTLTIGNYPGLGFAFPGSVDDVRVYNRVLSPQEVKQLYNTGSADVAHSNTATTLGITSGLVGYWTFDGSATNWTAGTTADSSGSGNAGTLNSFSKTTSPVAGKIGQAFKFNGSSQYISHSHISAFEFGTGDFSVSFWIKPTSSWSGTTRGIIGQKSNDSSPGWQIYHDSGDGNSLRLRLGDSSGNGSDLMGVAVLPNVWTYVTVERKSGVLYGYANGVPSGTSVSNTKNISGGSANFNIGYADTWTAFYQGSLDDVRIYNRALSVQEVAQLYAMSK